MFSVKPPEYVSTELATSGIVYSNHQADGAYLAAGIKTATLRLLLAKKPAWAALLRDECAALEGETRKDRLRP